MEISIVPEKRIVYSLVPQPEFLFRSGNKSETNAHDHLWYQVGIEAGYSRPDNVGLVIGWAHDAIPEPDFEDSDQDLIEPPYNHKNGDDNHGICALMQMSDFVPELAEGQIVATLSGYYATTPDHTPIIGQDTNLSNLIHAVGCSGHGLMHAPITAATWLKPFSRMVLMEPGRVLLPAPFDRLAIDMHAFGPTRSFTSDEKACHLECIFSAPFTRCHMTSLIHDLTYGTVLYLFLIISFYFLTI